MTSVLVHVAAHTYQVSIPFKSVTAIHVRVISERGPSAVSVSDAAMG